MATLNRSEIGDLPEALMINDRSDLPLDLASQITVFDERNQAEEKKDLLGTNLIKLEKDGVLPPSDLLLASLPTNLSPSDQRLMANLDSVYNVVG